MNVHYRLVFDEFVLERCGSHVRITRGGKNWYWYNGSVTWRFDDDLPLAQPGFRLPSWEGITLLAMDDDDFYEELGEHTVSETEFLGRPALELVMEPRASVIVDKETGVRLGLRSPRASLLSTSFELLPGDMDATWTGPTRKIVLPTELEGRVVDTLPALDTELRVITNRHELQGELEDYRVGNHVPLALQFSTGQAWHPHCEQTVRGWVHIDNGEPDPNWHGLLISRGWTATYSTNEPRRGDQELTGFFYDLDNLHCPVTYVEITAIHAVLSHADAEEQHFLPVADASAVPTAGEWKAEEFIIDGFSVDPPPLVQWQPGYGYMLADDEVLWAACVDIPAVDAYSLETGELLRRVHVPAPLDQHRKLEADPEHGVVMTYGEQIFVLHSGKTFSGSTELQTTDPMCREFDHGIALRNRIDSVTDTNQMMLVIAGVAEIPLTSPEPVPVGISNFIRIDAFWFAGLIVTIVGDQVRFFTAEGSETTPLAGFDWVNAQRFQSVIMEYTEQAARFFDPADGSLITQFAGSVGRIVRGSPAHIVVLADHRIWQWRPTGDWTYVEASFE